jgi:hypothetical protein
VTTAPSSTVTQRGAVREIKIDSEHFSIRFLLPVLTLVLVLMVHIGGMQVMADVLDSDQSPLCLVLPADVVTLFGGSALIERLLKRAIPSRRAATLSPAALIVTDGRKSPPVVTRIEWHKTVNVRAWRFTVGRKGRVPRGWYCMAVQLLQDDVDTILYTFMKSDDAEKLPGYAQFIRLRPRKETLSNTDLNAVAEQRRMLKLEDARWEDGGEMVRDDFAALLAQVSAVVPGWEQRGSG